MTRQVKERRMEDTVGIDISKDTLDAYWPSNRKPRQFSNDNAGLKSLTLRLQKAVVSLVIFRATGYFRLLETTLAKNGILFARINVSTPSPAISTSI